MKEFVCRAAAAAAAAFAVSVCSGQIALAAATDSVVQFKVTATATRLSHDMKFAWAGAFNGTQCTSITVSPTTDKFPGDGMAAVKIPVSQLENLWLKAGDQVKADDPACTLLVTALYTDATFTRPATP